MPSLFSRKSRAPKASKTVSNASDAQSTTSFNSDSNIKSPSRMFTNRTSAGGLPTTPITSSPPRIPKVDLPKPPDPNLDPTAYLRSLGSVRDRSKVVTEKALRNRLNHFEVDMNKFPDVVSFVCRFIKRDYDAPFTSIPPHGCHQHFCAGGRDRIANLLSTFEVDNTEKCRRVIDLFLVSVLLDAGAGPAWSYKSAENGRIYKRSDGLAIASLETFKTGFFSGDPKNKFQVDKRGLRGLKLEQLAKAMQSRPGSEIIGLEARAELLVKLSDALDQKPEFFGKEGRPGNIVDHLLAHPTTQASSMPIVLVPVLWNVLMSGLSPIWPTSQTSIDGIALGDAWPCSSMPQSAASPTPMFSPFPNSAAPGAAAWESILPFHKLTQWLTYSLMQPMQSLVKIHFVGTELLTGLPDCRNGGLFIDLGVLTLKEPDAERGLQHYNEWVQRTQATGVEVAPMFGSTDDVVIEWRGVTVGLLDRLCAEVNRTLSKDLNGGELTLAQVLEAGSTKGGLDIAAISRPNTKESPILIDADGTDF